MSTTTRERILAVTADLILQEGVPWVAVTVVDNASPDGTLAVIERERGSPSRPMRRSRRCCDW